MTHFAALTNPKHTKKHTGAYSHLALSLAFCLSASLVSSHAGAATQQPIIEQRSLTQGSSTQPLGAQTSGAWQLYEKIQALEADIQQLRDKVEVLETQLSRHQSNSDKLILNVESRIDNLENGLVDVMNTTEHQQDGAAAVVGSLSEVEEQEAKSVYVGAYNIFKNEGASAGVAAMSQFIKDYAGSQLIPSAHYWLGEFYLSEAQPNFELAALNFSTVVNVYPTSDKAPTALYRLTSIASSDGDTAKAKRFAGKIISDYPDSKEAGLAKAFLKK